MALDVYGNFAVQNLIEAAHKLRVEAYALSKQVAAGKGLHARV